ncbi:MAG TPA: DNA-binding protein [Campylobacterales bacterium]|nr:DNA-binding protein [Campylobacterales bacterium]
MNKIIQVGKYNKLLIDRDSDYGFYLVAKDESAVLLPNSYITDDMNIGDEVEVFVYKDSEDRIVSTTQIPYLIAGEFEFLEVVDKSDFGVFVDIGLLKHVLVPKKMQKGSLRVGQKYLFALSVDISTNRLVADMRIHKYLSHDTALAEHLKAVDILVIAKTPMGYKVIVNNTHEGMLYNNEIFQTVKITQKLKAYVKKVRDDGKLDISLNPIGKNKTDTNSQTLLDRLKIHNGLLSYTYKSDADDIKKMFGMSKKAYKASLTKLIEDNQIVLDEKGIKIK